MNPGPRDLQEWLLFVSRQPRGPDELDLPFTIVFSGSVISSNPLHAMPNLLRSWLSEYLRELVDGSQPKSGVEFTELEARVCFSASPIAAEVMAEVANDGSNAEQFAVATVTSEQEQEPEASVGNEAAVESVTEVVIIDGGVEGGEALWSDLLDQFADDHVQVLIVESGENGIQQVSDFLSQFDELTTVHVVSHGSEGRINLGDSVLDSSSLAAHGHELVAWQDALAENADILLYGCDVAGNQDGRELVEGIAALTGADVAASVDRTGAAELGGDWQFEYIVGQVEGDVIFSGTLQSVWEHVLSDPVYAPIEVDTTNDIIDGDVSGITALYTDRGADGFISLREAIAAANNEGGTFEIHLGAGTYDITLNSSSGLGEFEYGDFDITSNLTFVGQSADLTIIDGNNWTQVFEVHDNNTASFSNLSITGGKGGNGGGINAKGNTDVTLEYVRMFGNQATDGGAIHMYNATLNLFNVSIFNNTASGSGGGLSLDGTVTLDTVTIHTNTAANGGGGINATDNGTNVLMTNTTVSGNIAGQGGGIRTDESLTIESSTIAFNQSTEADYAGGLIVEAGTTTLFNTIVANNLEDSGNRDNFTGALTSLGFNLTNTNASLLDHATDIVNTPANLNALQNNGGFVDTHSLQAGSAALNAGASGLGVDATGTDRQLISDIGAYEYIGSVSAIDDGVIYWSSGDGTISRGNPSLGTSQTILDGLQSPVGLTIDSVNGKLYWTDTDTDTVHRSNLDGTSVETILNSTDFNGSPAGLQVDTLRGRLYIVDNDASGNGDRILASDLDGSNLSVVVADAGTYPADITVDHVNEFIYWGDPIDDVIYRANLDGSNPITIVDGAQGPVALDIDFQNQLLYWTDNAIVGADVLRRMDLETGVVEMTSNITNPLGVSYDNVSQNLYWTEEGGEIIAMDVSQNPSPTSTAYSGVNPYDVEAFSLNGNAAPVGVNDEYAMTIDASGMAVDAASGVLSNDTDSDSTRLIAVLGAGPTNADSFTLNTDGSFSYVPTSGFVGNDTFTYTVFDGATATNDVLVTIHVEEVTAADAGGPYKIVLGDSVVLDGSGSVDGPEQGLDYEWQFGANAIPPSSTSQVTITDAELQAVGFDTPGTYTVTLKVTDGRSATNTGSASLTIVDNQMTISGVEDETYTLKESDFPTGVEDFEVTTLPSGTLWVNGAAISANTVVTMQSVRDGNVSYVPEADVYGSSVDGFSFILDDLSGSEEVTVTIDLEARADAPQFAISGTAIGPLFEEDRTASTEISILRSGQDGAEITHFKLTNIQNGTLLLLDGTRLAEGDFITAAQATDGLNFEPDADFSGEATFDAQASTTADDSGLGPSSTMTFNVDPVNDAPILHGAQQLNVGEFLANFSNSAGITVEDAIKKHPNDFISDVDEGAVEGLAIHSVDDTNGVWELSSDDGATWSSFASAGITGTADYSQGLLLTETFRIRFVSNVGFEGETSFEARAWDQTTGLAGQVADTSATQKPVMA
ncbi:MAG: DUF4347 domain-containing protein, partial [Planctomycetota bacterium]